MLELKHGCVGMRCPVCDRNIIEFVNVFQFASGSVFRCPECAAPVLSISKNFKKGNFSLSCFACGESHTYKISRQCFFSGKLSSFGCKENLVDVLFTGSYDEVQTALDRLSVELKSLADKYYENIEQKYGKYQAAAIRILEEKAKEKRIICLCGNYELSIKLDENGVCIFCPACNASEFIPAETEEDITNLINRRSILIK